MVSLSKATRARMKMMRRLTGHGWVAAALIGMSCVGGGCEPKPDQWQLPIEPPGHLPPQILDLRYRLGDMQAYGVDRPPLQREFHGKVASVIIDTWTPVVGRGVRRVETLTAGPPAKETHVRCYFTLDGTLDRWEVRRKHDLDDVREAHRQHGPQKAARQHRDASRSATPLEEAFQSVSRMNEQPAPAGRIDLTQVTRTTEGLPTGYTVSQAILTLEDCLGYKLSDIPMPPIADINTCEVHRLSDQLVVYVLSDDTPSSVTCNIDHDGMVIQVTRATSRDTTVALMRYEAGKFSVDLIRPGDKGLQSTADSSLPPPVLYSRSLEAEFDRYDNSTTLSAGEVLRQFVRITRCGLGRGCGHFALTYGEPEAAPLLPVPWLGVMPITAGVIAVPAQEEQDSPRLEEVAFQLSWNEHGLPTQLSYADTPSDGAPPAGNYAWTVDERGNWTSWQRLPFTAPQIASGGERADVLGQQAPHTGPPPTVCRKITYADGTVSTPPSHLLDLIRTANN